MASFYLRRASGYFLDTLLSGTRSSPTVHSSNQDFYQAREFEILIVCSGSMFTYDIDDPQLATDIKSWRRLSSTKPTPAARNFRICIR